MNVNISIGPGEVCTYDIRADCGLPSFFPEGEGLLDLKIMSIDYDDGDTPIDKITFLSLVLIVNFVFQEIMK